MANVLTFDLGTTFFKACIFDAEGQLLGLSRKPTPTAKPVPDRREIPVDAFHDAVAGLVDDLSAEQPEALGDVRTICFATQANSFVLLDEQDVALTPIILWSDHRAAGMEGALASVANDRNLRRESGLPTVPIECAIAKLAWIREHDPDVWRRARRFLHISDVLVWWLTGRSATEAGVAGLSGLLDIHQLTWRQGAIHAIGAEHLQFPEPLYAGADLGLVRPEIAARLGLHADCRLVLGCLDQYAGAIGAGNTTPGRVSETTGTVLATVALTDAFAEDLSPEVFLGPAWKPGLWWRMAFGSISANLLEALRQEEPEAPAYTTLDSEARSAPDTSTLLELDPARSLAEGRPVYRNLGSEHTRGHRVGAIYRAVAGALAEQVREVLGEADANHAIRCVGGAAQSDYWLATKARVLDRPVVAVDCPEPTSLGAAILALSTRTGTSVHDVATRVVRPRTPGSATA